MPFDSSSSLPDTAISLEGDSEPAGDRAPAKSMTGNLGLAPVLVPGISASTEQPRDRKFLGWGPLPETHLEVAGSRARTGIWLRWEGPEKRSPVRVWVRFEEVDSLPLTPVLRARRGLMPPVCRFVQTVRHLGPHREVLVEISAGKNHELMMADLRDFPMYGEPPVLRTDPDDSRPLGGRVPVVVSHGLLWDSPHMRLSGLAGPIFFNALRAHKLARKLRDNVKWYAFDYPSWRHPAENGQWLAREACAMLEREQTRHPAILLGHSLGGLVQRYAMNHDEFGEQVSLSISAGSPHRGALFTSLASATGNLALHMAPVDLALLRRWGGYIMPDCPGHRGVFWDNADGAFDRPDREAFALPPNPELARFNREDAYIDRLLCVAGDCERLGLNRWVSPHERLRWAQANYFDGFENTDPFVPLASATFEGAPVMRSTHSGADHLGWALWQWQLDILLKHVSEAV